MIWNKFNFCDIAHMVYYAIIEALSCEWNDYGSTIKRGNLVAVKTTICYWEFNDRKEHGFSKQLVGVKLLKHAEELEVVEDLKDI
jgi:hypothetical protein